MDESAIKPARVRWLDSGLPFSLDFNDIYISDQFCKEEVVHSYLHKNHLDQTEKLKATNTIAEIGFGTGFNLMVCADLWQSSDKSFHYFSIEQFPLTKKDFILAGKAIIKKYPELACWHRTLVEQYPPLTKGFHHIALAENIRVTLVFMEASEAVKNLPIAVEHWILDGFSPKKNPLCWQQKLIQLISKKSAEQALFSSYSCSGGFLRLMTKYHFKTAKAKGYGKKRHFSYGIYQNTVSPAIPPWFEQPAINSKKKTATVIGAGIAGCSCAFHLAQSGWRVNLIEKSSHIASQGSGNPLGSFKPVLDKNFATRFQMYLMALEYCRYFFKQYQPMDIDLKLNGIFSSLPDNKRQKLTKDWLQQYDFLNNIFQYNPAANSVFFPTGGFLSPIKLCRFLSNHKQIKIIPDSNIKQIIRENQQWLSLGENNTIISQSDILVDCTTSDLSQQVQPPCYHLLAQKTRLYKVECSSHNLQHAYSNDAYLIPQSKKQLILGTSKLELAAEDVLQTMRQVFNLSIQHHKFSIIRTGTKYSTVDHFPIIGALPDVVYYQKHYQDLHKGKAWRSYPSGRYLDGLFTLTGLGSKGILTGLWGAKILTDMINNRKVVLPVTLLQAIHPARFIIQKQKKGNCSAYSGF